MTEIPGRRRNVVELGVVFVRVVLFGAEAIQPGQRLVEKLAHEAGLFYEVGVAAGTGAAEFGTLRDVARDEVGQGHRFEFPQNSPGHVRGSHHKPEEL